jgi:hypothetical protein
MLSALQHDLHASGRMEWSLWCLDGFNVRVRKAAADTEKNQPEHEPLCINGCLPQLVTQ